MNSRGAIRRAMVFAGILLIVSATIWLIGGVAGMLPIEGVVVAGHSGLRAIAGLAVVGCLLAAIGSWDN